MRHHVLPVLFAATTALLASCAQVGPPPPAPSAFPEPPPTVPPPPPPRHEEFKAFVSDYIEQAFKVSPTFAVYQGRHEYDGQVDDMSPAAIDAQIAWLRQSIAHAQSFTNDQLTPEEQFERDYLIARAKGQLFWIDPAGGDQPHRNPAAYVGLVDPSVYVTVPYAEKDVRLKAYTAMLEKVPATLAQMRANLVTPLPLAYVDYAKNAFAGYVDYYPGDGVAAWKGVGSAADQAALKTATAGAVAATRQTVAWIESQRATAGTNFALGAATFSRMLADTEMVTTPLGELQRIGEADLASNQALLKQACARYAPGKPIEACMDKMSANKPQGGAVAGARAQLAGLKKFIVDNDIVTIPGTEEAKVDEAPPYNRQNFAYINIPGPFEHGLPSTYYIAPADPSWPKAERDAFVPGQADLLFTSVHEVWPGHFLNFLHSNRSSFLFGRVFVGYAFAEGWAHYTEEMMRVAGVGGGTDEIVIGQLSNALLRDCRFLSAIGLHSGTMSLQQSHDLFKSQCFQDEGTAKQQSLRGTYDPAYLNYTLGKLMIRKLRDDWVASRGGRPAWKAFHDQFLSYGGPPIPLVRQQMMHEAEAKAVF